MPAFVVPGSAIPALDPPWNAMDEVRSPPVVSELPPLRVSERGGEYPGRLRLPPAKTEVLSGFSAGARPYAGVTQRPACDPAPVPGVQARREAQPAEAGTGRNVKQEALLRPGTASLITISLR